MTSKWNTVPLAELASISLSGVDKHIHPGETSVKLCNYLDVYRNRRLSRATKFAPGSATAGEIARFRLKQGDVVITKDSETPDDIGVPSLVVEDLGQTICGYHLALLRPKENVNPSFLLFQLQSEMSQRHFLKTAPGVTRFGLGARAIASLPVLLPPREEQAAIVCVLDAVDTAIERMCEALGRIAILRRALMQQLLPPWIGFRHVSLDHASFGLERIEIAKDVAEVCNGSTPSRAEGRYWRDGSIPWLPTGKVHDRVILEADEHVTEAALKECSIRLLPRGSVLVGMIGQGRTRGMSAYLDMEACINQNFGAFVPRTNLFGKWLFYYFDFHYSRLREIGGGTNQGALNCYLLKRIRLPLPAIERQQEVAGVLDGVEDLHIAGKLALARQMNLKKSLMHDLLTGNVRVKQHDLEKTLTQ